MTYDRRRQIIEIARQVECGAIDVGDVMALAAARRVIQALGWMRKANPADVALVLELDFNA